jgi:hypothetical protein
MAIDPERLRGQAAEVASLIQDRVGLERETRALFEEYQVRRRQAGRTVLRVPKPVLRTLSRAFQVAVSGDAQLAASTIETLWNMKRAEARELASRTLGEQTADFVPDLVEGWATQRLPLEQLEQLADRGLAGWRQSRWQDFVHRIAGWLTGKQVALALFALDAAVADGSYADLPSVFKSLHGLTAQSRGRARRALSLLIGTLAHQAPAETAHFLLGELERGGAASGRLIRAMVPDLPSAVRTSLEGQGGIMRPISVRKRH